jgi:hypothetical protein
MLNLVAWVLWLASAQAQNQDRIFVEARLNGTAVRMAFDTGADRVCLFKSTAERLGLEMSTVKTLFRRWDYFGTEQCTMDFWDISLKGRVRVLAIPPFLHPEEDGLIGWIPVANRILAFDALNLQVRILQELPQDARGWTRLRIESDWRILALKVPGQGGGGTILIDTGSASGMGIPPAKWREWRQAHAGEPVTLDSLYTPAAGLFAREQAWASEFTLGPLALTDVVIEQADPWSLKSAARGYMATLGLAALKRLDFIVDGKHGMAYLRPKPRPSSHYEHNRSGAVFMPTAQSDDLVAQVVDGSPAASAGIRNGDVLLKIGETQMANWRTDTSQTARVFWQRPAGTRVALTLQRSNETFKTTVTLRDILAPRTNPP